MKNKFIYLTLLLICFNLCFGQTLDDTQVKLRNFNLMVIPFLQDDEKISSKLLADPTYRNAISLVQDKLVEKKLRVLDFTGKHQTYYQHEGMKEKVDDTDTKAHFLDYAAPDMYAELEISHITCTPSTHKARILLKTYLTSTGELLTTKVEDSNCFNNDVDVTGLIKNALKKFISKYVENLQTALNDMNEMGQLVQVHMTIDSDANYDFNDLAYDKELGAENSMQLSEAINIWLDDHPEQVFYSRSSGATARSLILNEVRIPLLNVNSKRLYSIDKFTRVLAKYIRTLQFQDFDSTLKIKVETNRIKGVIYINLK